jgi:signal transduction histidine kinase
VRRLSLQIYVGFLAMLLLCSVVFALAWWLLHDTQELPHRGHLGPLHLLIRLLPPADVPPQELQDAVERYGDAFRARITLRSADGTTLASTGGPLPPPIHGVDDGPQFPPDEPPVFTQRLADGREVWLQPLRLRRGAPGPRALAALGAAALALALGAFLLSRRITRRLETLQSRVEALGEGDLTARVTVEGSDEVAKLAASFNRSAAQIERLVGAQRDTLAFASHELRSPLARLSMAVELIGREPRPELVARARADIAELDELIEELLLASRLDANLQGDKRAREAVDMLALAAEEAARVGAEVQWSGTDQSAQVTGDTRMLRRLLRNLLENARRYAAGTPVTVTLDPLPGGLRLRVEDAGPGVPQAEQARIFEPFYRPRGTAESGSGIGLGLALVRRIARHHGGDARYLARRGGGACFEVELRSGAAKPAT